MQMIDVQPMCIFNYGLGESEMACFVIVSASSYSFKCIAKINPTDMDQSFSNGFSYEGHPVLYFGVILSFVL